MRVKRENRYFAPATNWVLFKRNQFFEMRKLLTLLALVLASGASYGQFTMTDADFPQVGGSQTYLNLDTTGIVEGMGGPGQTWDFSAGTVTSQTRNLNIIAPSAHPAGNTFPSSTHCYDFSNGDYRFYTMDSDSLVLDGEVSLLNTPISFSDKATVYRFPMNIGAFSIDSFYSLYSTGAAGNAIREGQHNTQLDADGTLILPNGVTYNNVNRTVTFIILKDSSVVFPLVSDIIVTRLEWYQQGISMPVLWSETKEVAANGGAPTVTKEIWFLDTTVVNIEEANIFNEVNLYPNPAQDQVRLSYELSGSAATQVEVFNLMGERVHFANQGEQLSGNYIHSISTAEMARGIYLVKLSSGDLTTTKKLILK